MNDLDLDALTTALQIAEADADTTGWGDESTLVFRVVGGASGHVVAVVGTVVVVVDKPCLQGPVEQSDVIDADAVEVGTVELAQHGAMEPLADRVVVLGAWRNPVMDQPQFADAGLERLADELRAVVGQDAFQGDPVLAQRLAKDALNHFAIIYPGRLPEAV